jgi:DNA-binding GntR family transcriptional regulator
VGRTNQEGEEENDMTDAPRRRPELARVVDLVRAWRRAPERTLGEAVTLERLAVLWQTSKDTVTEALRQVAEEDGTFAKPSAHDPYIVVEPGAPPPMSKTGLIRAEIRAALAALADQPGAPLPRVVDLASTLGVRRTDVSSVYQEFEAEGLVQTHGQGRHVAWVVATGSPTGAPLREEIEAYVYRQIAVTPVGELLVPTARIAAEFAVSEPTVRRVLRRARDEGLLAPSSFGFVKLRAPVQVVPSRGDASFGEVASRLRRAIVDDPHGYAPGTRVVQRVIGKVDGVSVQAVLRAVKTLCAEGWLDVSPSGRATVSVNVEELRARARSWWGWVDGLPADARGLPAVDLLVSAVLSAAFATGQHWRREFARAVGECVAAGVSLDGLRDALVERRDAEVTPGQPDRVGLILAELDRQHPPAEPDQPPPSPGSAAAHTMRLVGARGPTDGKLPRHPGDAAAEPTGDPRGAGDELPALPPPPSDLGLTTRAPAHRVWAEPTKRETRENDMTDAPRRQPTELARVVDLVRAWRSAPERTAGERIPSKSLADLWQTSRTTVKKALRQVAEEDGTFAKPSAHDPYIVVEPGAPPPMSKTGLLRAEIRAAHAALAHEPGAPLPRVVDLAREHGVTPPVVSHVYQALEAEGLVQTHGQGHHVAWVVASCTPMDAPPLGEIIGKVYRQIALTPAGQPLMPTAQMAAAFGVSRDTVVRILRGARGRGLVASGRGMGFVKLRDPVRDPARAQSRAGRSSAEVASRLRRAIVDDPDAYSPGRRVVKRVIGEAEGVSRDVVQRALRTLSVEGWLDVAPSGSATVSINVEELRALARSWRGWVDGLPADARELPVVDRLLSAVLSAAFGTGQHWRREFATAVGECVAAGVSLDGLRDTVVERRDAEATPTQQKRLALSLAELDRQRPLAEPEPPPHPRASAAAASHTARLVGLRGPTGGQLPRHPGDAVAEPIGDPPGASGEVPAPPPPPSDLG